MRLLIIILLSVSLTQCGPSERERAELQKAREDSIILATERATKLRIQQRSALISQSQTLEANIEGKQNLLSVLNADLVVQRDKLERVRQPQFLRTPQEREGQIRALVMTIEQTEKDISAVKEEITDLAGKLKHVKNEIKKYE